MFQKSAISCLVIPRMEAILEYGCLDVISLHPFFYRNRVNLTPGFRRFNMFPVEVLPNRFSLFVFDIHFPLFTVAGGDCSYHFRCLFVDNPKSVFVNQIKLKSTWFTCIPLDTSSKPCSLSAANLRLSSLW